MKPKVIGNFPLTTPMLLDCLRYFPVPLLLIPDSLLREYLFQSRPVRIPLVLRYLRRTLLFLEMVNQLAREFCLAQNSLTPHVLPNAKMFNRVKTDYLQAYRRYLKTIEIRNHPSIALDSYPRSLYNSR